jgi:hypothetical protein
MPAMSLPARPAALVSACWRLLVFDFSQASGDVTQASSSGGSGQEPVGDEIGQLVPATSQLGGLRVEGSVVWSWRQKGGGVRLLQAAEDDSGDEGVRRRTSDADETSVRPRGDVGGGVRRATAVTDVSVLRAGQ